MKVGVGIWRGVKEGMGVGAQQRLALIIMRGPRPQAVWKVGILQEFLVSAAVVVNKFGPRWAKREVQGYAVGVWFLLLCWSLPPAILAILAILAVHGGS